MKPLSAQELFDVTKLLLRAMNLPTLTSADFGVIKRAAEITLRHAIVAKARGKRKAA